jgi:putative colanic acid biosynthesis acetyltransferase WcaF
MSSVRLSTFDNSWYHPGRSLIIQVLWFLAGAPVLSSRLIPFSGCRQFILRLFGSRIGKGVVLKPGIRVKYPWRLSIGDESWIGEDCWLESLGEISIGKDVCISQGAYLCTGNHDWSDVSFGLIVKGIVVRDGSWVGARCFIGPGVQICEGAIAAAGSIVTKDIPEYQIHGGNPARFVRHRTLSGPAAQSV